MKTHKEIKVLGHQIKIIEANENEVPNKLKDKWIDFEKMIIYIDRDMTKDLKQACILNSVFQIVNILLVCKLSDEQIDRISTIMYCLNNELFYFNKELVDER